MNRSDTMSLKMLNRTLITVLSIWLALWLLAFLFIDFEKLYQTTVLIHGIFLAVFVAFMIILFLQQKKELKALRQILDQKSNSVQRKSGASDLNRVVFANHFFNLLHVHQRMLYSMHLIYEGERFEGRDALVAVYNQLVEQYKKSEQKSEESTVHETIKASVSELYQSYEAQLNPYFQQLLVLIQFLEEIDENDRPRFAKILQSTFSEAEMLLIFYYCLGGQKFSIPLKKYVDRYELLKFLPVDMIDKEHQKLYRAF